MMAAMAVAGTFAFAAQAQTNPAPSPEKMALARQLVEATGGAKQVDAVLRSLFQSMGSTLGANLPPEQRRLQTVIFQKLQARMSAIVPKMLDATVEVYADNLSDKELHDYVAWMQSDSGRSVIAKMPQIMSASFKTMMPMITEMTEGIKKDVIDEACAEAKCTPHDREVLIEAMNKSMPKRPS